MPFTFTLNGQPIVNFLAVYRQLNDPSAGFTVEDWRGLGAIGASYIYSARVTSVGMSYTLELTTMDASQDPNNYTIPLTGSPGAGFTATFFHIPTAAMKNVTLAQNTAPPNDTHPTLKLFTGTIL